jgi:hypothetical protein
MQKFLGVMKEQSTMKIDSKMSEGCHLRQGKFEKENGRKTIKFYQNDNTITCIITLGSNNNFKGVGVAKCHPEDNFDLFEGILIAELRARSDFYKRTCEIHIGK